MPYWVPLTEGKDSGGVEGVDKNFYPNGTFTYISKGITPRHFKKTNSGAVTLIKVSSGSSLNETSESKRGLLRYLKKSPM